MKIAQVAPLHESVPPRTYGGTERVVSYLTEALVDAGHEVTLYASGDSRTRAELVPVVEEGLRLKGDCRDPLAHHVLMLDRLLRDAHSADNLSTVMCRNLVSVDWQGYLYDCDFNQMLDMPLQDATRKRPHLQDLMQASFEGRSIRIAEHCYGCTAGQGSSCGGALNE